MAVFNTVGLDTLAFTYRELAEIPPEVKLDMVNAAADVAIAAFKAAAPVDTGQLKNSIGKKVYKGPNPYADVYPLGKRSNGVRNAEVGFILEYGAPRRHLPARQWMSRANTENAEAYA